jgi:hypothetical protein
MGYDGQGKKASSFKRLGVALSLVGAIVGERPGFCVCMT